MKPSLPQGTRDFEPAILRKRYFIIETIRKYFELYGFNPLETPAIENLETLMGKYGDEGDKLIFKILNNGLNNPDKRSVVEKAFKNVLQGLNDKDLTSRALRYDLTIPFARFVASNYHALPIPFKRYQIQPVWRADRPQKGRYREFYQCDADIAGTQSLTADAEFALLYRDVFSDLKIPVTIKLNNRKLITGLAEAAGIADHIKTVTVIIDKLDKTGKEVILRELADLDFSESAIDKINEYLCVQGDNKEKIRILRTLLEASPTGLKGLDELDEVISLAGDDSAFEIDTTLARGLDYYTGTIYEIKAQGVKIGSIGGGGRYDNLTGLFGLDGVPAVGISFGIDRIYDVMEESGLFPENISTLPTVLFFNLGEKESAYAFSLVKQCRENGIIAEIYYETARLGKQFKYAEKRNIRYVVIIGSREIEEEICNLKDLSTGNEEKIQKRNLTGILKQKLRLPG